MKKIAMNGDQAVALSWKQVEPDVVASYPITPQTIIVEMFSEYVADGLVNTEYVTAESEHSAMSICIGASASGARTATATASAGLAYMWEVLYVASGMRLPIVMVVANRALSGPINIHCDHSDAMGARDSGWIQLFGENVQEAYDNSIMAFRVAEHMDVRMPMMTCLDGFIVTHSLERFEPLPDDVVKSFVGPFKYRRSLLDFKNPITMGPFDWTDYYFEHKYQQVEAMKRVTPVVNSVAKEYAKVSGREYQIIEPYKLDDADYAVLAMGSTAGTLKEIVDELRAEGQKVGAIKLRLFRPFPHAELAKMVEGLKGLAIMDRAVSIGAEGPIFPEARSALYESKQRPRMTNYIYGLGGRDIRPEELKHVFNQLIHKEGETVNYLGVRK